jgi:hypothetical protein
MKNAYKPAYPFVDNQDPEAIEVFKGLTKRELFAMHAMQGIISGYPDSEKVNGIWIPELAYVSITSQAVQIANSLLNQLDK